MFTRKEFETPRTKWSRRGGRHDRERQDEREPRDLTAHRGRLPHHSHLNAVIGSTFIARRAGIQLASAATNARNPPTTMNVTGSNAPMPKSRSGLLGDTSVERRIDDTPAAATMPTAAPANTGVKPCRTTIRNTSAAVAPRAMRKIGRASCRERAEDR